MKNQKTLLRTACLALIVTLLATAALCFAGCGKEPAKVDMTEIAKEINSLKTTDFEESSSTTEYVRITVKNHGDIVLRLRKDIAPETVENFRKLVSEKFYDGLTFHRVIPGFMIQGGDPAGTGAGGPDYCIKGEFSQNGFENNLAHTPGVLSMARTMFPDSAGSQFFIMHKAAPHLDGAYAAFGKVTEGLEVVDKIASVNTDYSDKPLQPQKMATVTVETFGVEYPEPEKC